MLKIKRDQIMGCITILLGLIVFYLTSQFKTPFTASYPGPKLLPSIAAFGFIVCGAGIFIESMINKKEDKVFMVKEGWLRMIYVLLLLALYVFAMTYVGYLIATPFIVYILTSLFAKGSRTTMISRILFSVLLTGSIYAIYVLAFGLGLPTGIF